jgi:molybdopterin converting factor small subunit
MATVVVPALLRGLCGGTSHLDVPGDTVGAVLRAIDERCPGIYERVVDHGHLRPELAFAVDGEVVSLALHDHVAANAEIAIVPAIGGG